MKAKRRKNTTEKRLPEEKEQRLRLLQDLAGASRHFDQEELLDLAAEVASQHPGLKGKSPHLRVLLAWEANRMEIIEKLAGAPRDVVSSSDPERSWG